MAKLPFLSSSPSLPFSVVRSPCSHAENQDGHQSRAVAASILTATDGRWRTFRRLSGGVHLLFEVWRESCNRKKKSRNKNHFNHKRCLTEKPHSRQQDGWIYPLGKLKSYFLYSTFAFKVAIRAEFSGGLYVLSCTVYSLYLLLLLYTAFLQHFWLATKNFGRGTQEQNHEWAEEMVNRGNKMLVLEQEVLIS